MHIQSQLLAKTGLEEVLNSCDLDVVAPGNAVLSVPLITRARYMMEVYLTLECVEEIVYFYIMKHVDFICVLFNVNKVSYS
jgi:hypothetical protein